MANNSIEASKTNSSIAAKPKAANSNSATSLKQIKNNFNQWRGLFIAEFSKYEFTLCETLHAIKKHTDIIKSELPNTASARTDLILNLVAEDNKLKPTLEKIKTIAKEIEKYEALRNILAHAKLSLMKNEDEDNVFMLLVFANNGQSAKKEVEFVDMAELKSLCSKIATHVDDFENHATIIQKLWVAS